MLGVAGDTSIDTRVASVTVKVVSPITSLLVAEMLLLPTPAADARPCEPAALLTVATVPSDEAQVTCVVRSCVELSVNNPVAANCCVRPFAMLGAADDTSIETRVASVTVKVASPVTPPLVADRVVLPTPAADASPCEPAALLTVATVPWDEPQVTCVVRSWVDLSV